MNSAIEVWQMMRCHKNIFYMFSSFCIGDPKVIEIGFIAILRRKTRIDQISFLKIPFF